MMSLATLKKRQRRNPNGKKWDPIVGSWVDIGSGSVANSNKNVTTSKDCLSTSSAQDFGNGVTKASNEAYTSSQTSVGRGGSSSTSSTSLAIGNLGVVEVRQAAKLAVWVQFKINGTMTWYRGVVLWKVQGEEMFDIRYEDGLVTRMSRALIATTPPGEGEDCFSLSTRDELFAGISVTTAEGAMVGRKILVDESPAGAFYVDSSSSSSSNRDGDIVRDKRSRTMVSSILGSISEELVCSISHELMVDPVCTLDGATYERKEIETWFQENDSSPETNLRLDAKTLIPNKIAKNTIAKLLATGELGEKVQADWEKRKQGVNLIRAQKLLDKSSARSGPT